MIELPGGLLILDADEAVLVGQFVLAGEAKVYRAYTAGGLPIPAKFDSLVAGFAERVRRRRRESPLPQGFATRAATVSPVDTDGFAATACERITTGEAAERLKISEQRVRTLCRKGHLAGVRSSEGHGAMWLITEESVRSYQTTRRARGQRAGRDVA